MGRWRDVEITNNGSRKRLFLNSDINWKIRWAYSPRNYVDNLTNIKAILQQPSNAIATT